MKNNGFTLIELTAVIVVIAILATITMVAVNHILLDTEETLSARQIENIEKAAETYYLKEGMNSDDICVSVDELISKGYIKGDSVKNPQNQEEMTGYVKINYEANQYSYIYQEKSCE